MTPGRWGREDLREETVMILVCGATGDLGGRIARLLVSEGRRVRALVRPATDATGLEDDGIQVIRGDLRDPASLDAAMAGVDTVITTANAIGRLLAGAKDLTIAAVDGEGNKHLIRAAAGPAYAGSSSSPLPASMRIWPDSRR